LGGMNEDGRQEGDDLIEPNLHFHWNLIQEGKKLPLSLPAVCTSAESTWNSEFRATLPLHYHRVIEHIETAPIGRAMPFGFLRVRLQTRALFKNYFLLRIIIFYSLHPYDSVFNKVTSFYMDVGYIAAIAFLVLLQLTRISKLEISRKFRVFAMESGSIYERSKDASIKHVKFQLLTRRISVRPIRRLRRIDVSQSSKTRIFDHSRPMRQERNNGEYLAMLCHGRALWKCISC